MEKKGIAATMSLLKDELPPATPTTLAQREVELSLLRFLRRYHPDVDALWGTYHCIDSEETWNDDDGNGDSTSDASLYRELHKNYLQRSLVCLGESTQGLYSAQPWLVYWALQAADVLGISEELYEHVCPDDLGEFILACLQEVKTAGDSGVNHVESKSDSDDVYKNTPHHSSGSRENEGGQPLETVELRHFGASLVVTPDDGKRLIGFAGGRLAQMPHLATSYAAVCSLCILARPLYLQSIPRAAIKRWILSLRQDDGSFCMHVGGEADIRASYCAAVIVTLLQLNDVSAYCDGRDDTVLTAQTAAFVASCQTQEGGFSCGNHATEAHGAYTQCGLAALVLMEYPHLCKYPALRRWLTARQLKFEGGFNGRTNKLVDSCYSHWVGASHILLHVGEAYAKLLGKVGTPQCLTARETLLLDHAQLLDVSWVRPENEDVWLEVEETHRQRAARVEKYIHASATSSTPSTSDSFLDEKVGDFLFNQRRLLLYVLSCCQNRESGGLMDKPHFPNDAYHTCYALSGMSSAQNLQYLPRRSCTNDDFMYSTALRHGYVPGEKESYGVVLARKGPGGQYHQSPERLSSTNPIFNIHRSCVLSTLQVWGVKNFLY